MINDICLIKCLFATDWFVCKVLLDWLQTVLFLLPLINSFPGVCLPPLFAAALNFFLLLTTSSNSGAVTTDVFFSWDDIFMHKWNCGSPKSLCKCTDSPSTCRPIPLQNAISVLLEETNLWHLSGYKWMLEEFPNVRQNNWYQQMQKVFFHRSCLWSWCDYYDNSFWAAVWRSLKVW